MVGVVAQLAVEGCHHRVRFTANRYGLQKAIGSLRVQCSEQRLPASFPPRQQFFSALMNNKLGVTITCRTFAVFTQIAPTRDHVAAQVFNDDRQRIVLRPCWGEKVSLGLFQRRISQLFEADEMAPNVLEIVLTQCVCRNDLSCIWKNRLESGLLGLPQTSPSRRRARYPSKSGCSG